LRSLHFYRGKIATFPILGGEERKGEGKKGAWLPSLSPIGRKRGGNFRKKKEKVTSAPALPDAEKKKREGGRGEGGANLLIFDLRGKGNKPQTITTQESKKKKKGRETNRFGSSAMRRRKKKKRKGLFHPHGNMGGEGFQSSANKKGGDGRKRFRAR